MSRIRKSFWAAGLSALALAGLGGGMALGQSPEPTLGTATFTNVVTYTVPTVTETVTQTVTVSEPTPPPPPATPVKYGIANGSEITGNRSAADRARELDGIVALGARAIRIDAAWNAIEPSPGVWNWSKHDAVVSEARNRGLDTLITVTYAPAWANGGHSDNKFAPVTVGQRQAFADFAGAVAARYRTQGVNWFEVWNEPNHRGFWKPSPNAAHYADLLARTNAAIKAAHPSSVVLAGALAMTDLATATPPKTFLDGMYAAGAKGKFDALSVHPYIANNEGMYWEWWKGPDGSGSWFGPAPSVEATFRAQDPGKQIWFTETGDTRIATTSTAAVGKVMNQLRGYQNEGWGGPAFWYAYRSIDSYSLVDANWNPRPAWFTLRDWLAANP